MYFNLWNKFVKQKKNTKNVCIFVKFFHGDDAGFALAAFHDVSNRFEIISDCCFVMAIFIFYYFFVSIDGNFVHVRKNKLSGIRPDNSKYPAGYRIVWFCHYPAVYYIQCTPSHKTLEERLILGKYREAPRIDYGVKHKASVLIMRIYTCVLMLYKGRRSRTLPVYSLFKFQSKRFMFCKSNMSSYYCISKHWRTLNVKEYEQRYKIGFKRFYFKLKVYVDKNLVS